MKALEIPGPQRACGEVVLAGNKNAALPMIAAALLGTEPVVLHNVPDILDVRNMLAIAASLGVRCEYDGHTAILDAGGLNGSTPPPELCTAVRTSLLFAAPLAIRTGAAQIAHPGGDVIGRRRLDTHFYGLGKLGITATRQDDGYHFAAAPRREGTELFLDEASVTATEHILTAAVTAAGTTVIRNAACEPHVTQLAQLLNQMGARISGVETNLLVVEGVPRLHGAEFTIAADHVNAASYLALAAATCGDVTLHGEIIPHDYWMTRRVFQRLGINFTLEPGHIHLRQERPPCITNDLDGVMPTIADGPWPQFPSDMMSCLVTVATQAAGSVLFFEKMFESRIYFVDRLIAMGANAVVCDPHRVLVSGPCQLRAAELPSPDIRAGMALVIAACCARGVSRIRNADMVYRGYADLPRKLRGLSLEINELEL